MRGSLSARTEATKQYQVVVNGCVRLVESLRRFADDFILHCKTLIPSGTEAEMKTNAKELSPSLQDPKAAANQSKPSPPGKLERRKWQRTAPRNRGQVLVEIRPGETVHAVLVNESTDGACLSFREDPRLASGKKITVWYRQTPTKAEVKHIIAKLSDEYWIGVQWMSK